MESERNRPKPTREEIEKTALYFTELEDALRHYSSIVPPSMFKTLTVRANLEGEPETELVSETRFPPPRRFT